MTGSSAVRATCHTRFPIGELAQIRTRTLIAGWSVVVAVRGESALAI
ncbi:MAG: hypothetical protein OXL33_00255 [Chloroflexota bacterium]|nr:hypothetical protein [Chloroflexota bacterium]